MANRFKFCGILSILTIIMVLSRISFAQPSHGLSYIVKTSGDTIRNCEIKRAFKSTNEGKVTYIYGDTEYGIPAESIISYFHNGDFYVSEFLKDEHRHILISYIIGGASHFGQSFSEKGEVKFYLKSNDAQDVVSLSAHRDRLRSFLQGFLPDFDAFYSTYKGRVFYEYKSLAELFTAYNAFRDPGLYVPVKYKYNVNSRFGISASFGNANLELIDDPADFTNAHSYSVALIYKQFFTRSISLNLALAYNNTLFTGTGEDLHIRALSFDPAICIGTAITPQFDVALRGGFHLGYNFNSNLSIKTGSAEVMEITGFHLGPRFGVDLTFLKKYAVFMNYVSYNVKTDEGPRFLTNEIVKAKTNALHFGVIYYFKSIYSR